MGRRQLLLRDEERKGRAQKGEYMAGVPIPTPPDKVSRIKPEIHITRRNRASKEPGEGHRESFASRGSGGEAFSKMRRPARRRIRRRPTLRPPVLLHRPGSCARHRNRRDQRRINTQNRDRYESILSDLEMPTSISEYRPAGFLSQRVHQGLLMTPESKRIPHCNSCSYHFHN